MSYKLGKPPGPAGWPLLGVLPQLRRNAAEFFRTTADTYGDISRFRSGFRELYLLNRPDLIEEVLVMGKGNFIKSPILRQSKYLLGEGLLTSEGAFHLRQRKMAQPAFYRERLISYSKTMVACALRTSGRWQTGTTFDVADEMMKLTLSIVGHTLFTRDFEGDASDIGDAVTDVLSSFGLMLLPFSGYLRFLPVGPVARARRAQSVLDAKINAIIAERRASPAGYDDLLSTLLEGSGSDKQVRDEAMTLMLAGHETTANALTWTWYLISQHPEVEQRLRAEWREALDGKPPEFDDLLRLPYTEQVFAESLRLYPPAWSIARSALKEFRLFNYLIPAGAICVMSPWAMHRNPRFWDDPERFDPERFTPEAEARRPKFAYFPFGGGPRLCLGERFAWMEGVLVLAAVGQHWRFRLAPGHPVDILPQITLRPRYGMRMTAERVVA